MSIRNIVFDVGNVLVRWAPHEVIHQVFPEYPTQAFYHQIYPLWLELNLGKLTESEALLQYHHHLNLPIDRLSQLMEAFKTHQTPLPGSITLLEKLHSTYPLYAITDNVREIIAYHRAHSRFPFFFKDMIVSADLGILKPDPLIYEHLLQKHALIAGECVFIDDRAENIVGALGVGMKAFQFTNISACQQRLVDMGIQLS